MKKIITGCVFLVLLCCAACVKNGSSSNSCTFDACAGAAPDSEVVRIQNYIAANNISAVKHCSGLYYQIMTEGTGSQPAACSTVLVNYTGYFTNGTVFDKSASPSALSLLGVIQGWTRGVPLVKKGGKIKLIIPPSLAYGPKDDRGIPGNSILIFEIELLDFR